MPGWRNASTSCCCSRHLNSHPSLASLIFLCSSSPSPCSSLLLARRSWRMYELKNEDCRRMFHVKHSLAHSGYPAGRGMFHVKHSLRALIVYGTMEPIERGSVARKGELQR